MLQKFIEDVKIVYDKITARIMTPIEFCGFKGKWGITDNIGEVYQSLCERELKKDMGSFYTPAIIVDYMCKETLGEIDYKNDPYIRILDPSCGGGYFLMNIFGILRRKAKDTGISNIDEHILKHNIFGCDTDINAVMICVLEFYDKTGLIAENIVVKDFLTEYSERVDVIIGNPPYMGHKILTGEYRETLYSLYKDVFSDKADLSYCFIKQSIELLKSRGRLKFFTSRYILEALNGRGIRKYLKKSGAIKSIIDFYGVRFIKGVGVDNIILDFIKDDEEELVEVYRFNENAKGTGEKVFEDIRSESFEYVKRMTIQKTSLDDSGFVFSSELERRILDKLKGRPLGEICDSYQGIITGCDKAFIINEDISRSEGIENELLRPWIKGKNIESFSVSESEELIIYSDLISHENAYPNAVAHIEKHFDKLINRRECKKGMRKWYSLQWGRKLKLFEEDKIIYPYKANKNRFAIDKGNCFSADVYCIKIKEANKDKITYEFLAGILNSSLYEFYIKSIAKKLGDDLYEYYPNKIMTLKIPEYISEIDSEIKRGGQNLRERIDQLINKHFGINEEEFNIIKGWIK